MAIDGMTAVDLVLIHPAVVAMGWTLVHFLWQGCVIALVYWLICSLAPRHAATLRYWAGLAGMLLSLLLIGVTFLLSYAPEARFGLEPQTAAQAINPFLVLSGSLPDARVLLESGIEPALPWVVLLWLLGVSLLCVRTGKEWYTVHKLLSDSVVCSEVQLQLAFEIIKAKLAVQLAVRLMVSTRVVVPLVVGFLRPVILLPAGVLVRLPQDQLEMILAHELGHIRRFDYAFNLLQVALEILLFYHPAIVWMSQRVREEREHCCDELVVRQCGRPVTYARALANLEFMRSPSFNAAVPATGGNLLARIRLIADHGSHGKSSRLAQFALAAFAGAVVAFGAQQGYALSNELNRVASSAQLQASDVHWRTWGLSRQIWGQGVSRYAQSMRMKQLAVLKIESISQAHLLEPDPDSQAPTGLESLPAKALAMQHRDSAVELNRLPPFAATDAKPALPVSLKAPAGHYIAKGMDIAANAPLVSQLATAKQQEPETHSPESSPKLLNRVSAAKIAPLKFRPPTYPWRARRQGLEGFVELEFSVNAKGQVIDVEILDAVPEGVFEDAASKALLKWRFAGSEDSASRFRQVFDFELQELEKVAPGRRPCRVTGSRTCGQISPAVFVVWINSTTKSHHATAIN